METFTTTRKARFRAALALAHKTAGAWATEHEVTTSHLYAVLRGTRDSMVLDAAIDGFIAEYLPDRAA